MFLSNTQNSDYDYKKKQENLNVNKNRVTAYDHILPDNNPAQRLVAEEEEEQRQKEAAQLKKDDKKIKNNLTGVSKDDAQKLLTDFQTVFADKKFEKFFALIKLDKKGKSFIRISDKLLAEAIKDVKLSKDDLALITQVVNTINSEKKHEFEYADIKDPLSSKAKKLLDIDPQLKNYYNGLGIDIPGKILGGSSTKDTKKGSYSLIFNDEKYANDYYDKSQSKYVKNPVGRANTALHEIIGHGRSLSLGRGDKNQHQDAIQLENMILRVMGFGNIQRDGTDHGPKTKLSNAEDLPVF